MKRRGAAFSILLAGGALFLTTSVLGAVGDRVRGERLARENCSTCHAIGMSGTSPYRFAPPFRSLHEKYDVDGLAEALAEGIGVGNTGERQMPMFVLSADEIEDLIAYLKSLEPDTPRRPSRTSAP
ncbi:MAG TPA: cytochrome c [Micropepsaceae bacterium]|nr:cytochrome c [Micropepsaceae bacterium]